MKEKRFSFRRKITEARASKIVKQNEAVRLFEIGDCCACTLASHVRSLMLLEFK